MISYKIVSKKQPQTSSPNIKLFEDALKRCTFKAGDRIKVRGTANRGIITEIEQSIDYVLWKGKMPQFIAIKLDDDKEFLASPNQIKRSYS